MGRKKKKGFKEPKMFSARCELEDYNKFLYLAKKNNKKSLQETINNFILSVISGTLVLSGSNFVPGDGVPPEQPVDYGQMDLFQGDFGVNIKKNNGEK